MTSTNLDDDSRSASLSGLGDGFRWGVRSASAPFRCNSNQNTSGQASCHADEQGGGVWVIEESPACNSRRNEHQQGSAENSATEGRQQRLLVTVFSNTNEGSSDHAANDAKG